MNNRIEEIDLKSLNEARKEIRTIGCDKKSIDIMAPKAVFKIVIVNDINPIDAIIIKQDMLSIGGEVAIPKDVFWRKENCRIMIMGTLKHYIDLIEKLKRHHPRIKKIARLIETKVNDWLME